MDAIGIFAGRFVRDIVFVVDWAIGNWIVTMVLLVMLIYWAGRQRRLDRRHL
ncbi:MAG TPA: hypothetical protein VHV54_04810 [Candidatus Binatia bacterium]|nr:hypothetical protein [Candidatus Binatia bacterium]